MTTTKSIYGEHRTWDKSYWAYGVFDAKAVLVRCPTSDDAELERGRMKNSNATTVGSVTRTQISEMEIRKAMRLRGWKIEVIRNFI